MSLLLKFPDLHKGFDRCREIFKACDVDDDQLISQEELQQGLRECGFSKPEDKDIISALFKSSDLDKNHTIDFKEFVVALAVLYVLKKCKGLPMAGLHPQILQTFQTVLDSFLFFDKDHSGLLNKVGGSICYLEASCCSFHHEAGSTRNLRWKRPGSCAGGFNDHCTAMHVC